MSRWRPSARWRVAAAYALAWVAAVAFFHYQRDATLYDVDESGWSRAAIFTAGLICEGDLRPASWEMPAAGNYGNLNPPLGKLAFTVASIIRWPAWGEPLPEPPFLYVLDLTFAQNVREGKVAPDELRNTLRATNALLGAGLVLLAAGVLHLSVGIWSALFGGVLLAVNPTLIRLANQVMTDVPYNVFFMLALLLTLWASTAQTQRALKWRWRSAALAAAMASGVKLAAVFSMVPFLCVTALAMACKKRIGKRTCARMVAEVFILYGVAAVGLNPYLWPDFSHAQRYSIVAEWRLITGGEYEIKEGATAPRWLTSLKGAATEPGMHKLPPEALARLQTRMKDRLLVMNTIHSPFHPMLVTPAIYGMARPALLAVLYLRWADLKERFYEGLIFQPPDNVQFFNFLAFHADGFPLESLAAIAGIIMLAAIAMDHSAQRRGMHALVLLCYAATVTMVIYYTRLTDFDRYLFPLLIARTLLAGAALGLLSDAALRWARGHETSGRRTVSSDNYPAPFGE